MRTTLEPFSDMQDRTQEVALSLTKFAIGRPVLRSEDPKLVRGEGRYTDDINRPSQVYAVMVGAAKPSASSAHRHLQYKDDAGHAGSLCRR
jgi:hypothetical protein